MPIYEYYCPENHTIYSFFARTLAQGTQIPQCPDNPGHRLVKLVSSFAVTGGTRKSVDGDGEGGGSEGDGFDDPRMMAAMREMERTMESMDDEHPDPRAMGRMMRTLAEASGEGLEGPMEEVVRRLEAGEDPEKLEEAFGDSFGEGDGPMGDDSMGEGPGGFGAGGFGAGDGPAGGGRKAGKAGKARGRRAAPTRDPKIYDYD